MRGSGGSRRGSGGRCSLKSAITRPRPSGDMAAPPPGPRPAAPARAESGRRLLLEVARRSGAERVEHAVVVVVHREGDQKGAVGGSSLSSRMPSMPEEAGQPDVHEDDVRLRPGRPAPPPPSRTRRRSGGPSVLSIRKRSPSRMRGWSSTTATGTRPSTPRSLCPVSRARHPPNLVGYNVWSTALSSRVSGQMVLSHQTGVRIPVALPTLLDLPTAAATWRRSRRCRSARIAPPARPGPGRGSAP